MYIPPDTGRRFIHPVQGVRLYICSCSRTDIPHLHPKNVELDAFIGERLIAKGLAGCTDTLFKTAVKPQSVVTVTIQYISQEQYSSSNINRLPAS
jgi:hypothetical protein